MSRDGGRTSGRGRARGNGSSGRGRGRGRGYSGRGGQAPAKKSGLCAALTTHMFDCGAKGSADQMRVTLEKITHHVGTSMGNDICTELTNRARIVIPAPTHTPEVLARHVQRERTVRASQARTLAKDQAKLQLLEAAIAADANDLAAIDAKDELQADMDLKALEANEEVPIKLNEDERMAHQLLWKAYREREQKLTLHRGQAYSLIMGQCTTGLIEKMKYDAGWTNIAAGCDPLALLDAIDRAVLQQNDDTYPFATVYEMDSGLYQFHQDQLSNTE